MATVSKTSKTAMAERAAKAQAATAWLDARGVTVENAEAVTFADAAQAWEVYLLLDDAERALGATAKETRAAYVNRCNNNVTMNVAARYHRASVRHYSDDEVRVAQQAYEAAKAAYEAFIHRARPVMEVAGGWR